MCTCFHASGALAEHFAHNIPGFTPWVKCLHPYKNFSEFCALCFNLHSHFFINSSSQWHQKLKRKRENSTSRYEEAVICKAVFQTRHTFVIKHVSLSSTMQGTLLKSPHELHIEKSNQNSSFQKATFSFFHTIYSAVYFPFPSYLLRITISEKINVHGTMPIKEQCVSRVAP